MQRWFSVRAQGAAGPVVDIFGDITSDLVGAFAAELKALGEIQTLTVRINSLGGDPFAGIAIFNLLRGTGAKITARVEGVAASSASLIAMAADRVIMPENSFLMLHNPAGMALGQADDMRELADLLDRVAQQMASIYAAKSGKPVPEILALMDAETWLSAAEAVEAGFADELAPEVRIAARGDLSKFAARAAAARGRCAQGREGATARAARRH